MIHFCILAAVLSPATLVVHYSDIVPRGVIEQPVRNAGGFRWWTDTNGKRVYAVLVKRESCTECILRTKAGKELFIRSFDLSKKNQRYLETIPIAPFGLQDIAGGLPDSDPRMQPSPFPNRTP